MINKFGDTPLTLACRLGLYQKVKSLLEEHSDPNEINIHGWTPLMTISKHPNIKILKLLLKYNADIHYRFPHGKETVLMVASKAASYKFVKYLLKKGADTDVNIQDIHGWTALMIAARNACYKTVNILLEYKAKVNLVNHWGYTSLMLAATRIDEDMVNYSYMSNEYNKKNNKYIIKLLLNYHANIDFKNHSGQTVFDIAKEYKNNKELLKVLFNRKKKLLRRQCDICGIKVNITEKSLPVCGDCLGPRYCGTECQRKHWNTGHREMCKSFTPTTVRMPLQAKDYGQEPNCVIIKDQLGRTGFKTIRPIKKTDHLLI